MMSTGAEGEAKTTILKTACRSAELHTDYINWLAMNVQWLDNS